MADNDYETTPAWKDGGHTDVVLAIEGELRRQIQTQTVTVEDLMTLILNLTARLRLILTEEEVHIFLHYQFNQVNEALKNGAAFADPSTGQTVDVLSAEEKLALGLSREEESVIEVPDTVPEDWT